MTIDISEGDVTRVLLGGTWHTVSEFRVGPARFERGDDEAYVTAEPWFTCNAGGPTLSGPVSALQAVSTGSRPTGRTAGF